MSSVLREVHEAAERWRGAMEQWVRRSEALVQRWTSAPAGSELHVAEAFWHERHGETPAREIHSDPTDIDREYHGYDGRDRYGYDERDRVVIAYRAGKPGEEPTVECVASPGADGAV